jgi:ribonuclease HII
MQRHNKQIDPEDLEVSLLTCAGIDEAGRGPLAGPVIAAAVILGDGSDWSEVNDSKKLSESKREGLSAYIKTHAQAWALGRAEVAEIDDLNILNASLLAMQRAFSGLGRSVKLVLVDGNFSPDFGVLSYAVVKGDQRVKAIAAASILAKVARDQEMRDLHHDFPEYGFAQHKGYPSAKHLSALQQHGPCSHHRTSFRPVRECLSGNRAKDI